MEKPPNSTIHATDNVLPFVKKEKSSHDKERNISVVKEYVDVLSCPICGSHSFVLLNEPIKRIACEECEMILSARWTTRKRDWEKFRIRKDPK